MKSIQARLTITFIGLMVALLVIVWGVNRWYLEDFYVNQKVESLMRAYDTIDRQIERNEKAGISIEKAMERKLDSSGNIVEGNLQKLIRDYSDSANVSVLMVDNSSADATVYSTSRDTQFLKDRIDRYIFGWSQSQNELVEEKENVRAEGNPLAPFRLTEKKVLKSYVGHSPVSADTKLEFEGRLIGGCMDCLVTLLGTRFDRTADFAERYKEEGLIWFLEACDLNVFAIRRAMWQMEEAGWFRYVKGFLIGRPLCFGQKMMGLDAYQAVLKVAGEKKVPVIMDVDLGHLSPMMPLITGSHGKVSVCGNDISIQFS